MITATTTRDSSLYLSLLATKTNSTSTDTPSERSQDYAVSKRREGLAWVIILVQTLVIVCILQDNNAKQLHSSTRSEQPKHIALSVNEKPFSYHEKRFLNAKETNGTSYYDPPTIYPENSAALVNRMWHSNGSPSVHDNLQTGSCWCSTDEYCLCTPALAVDVILTTADDDVWLVKRRDTGKLALVGGFNEVGETVEEASRREMMEEMGLDLPNQPLTLMGVYSDPKRDPRKHPVSVVFHMELPALMTPTPGDDAMDAVRLPLSEVEKLESMHTDHKTVLSDFIQQRKEKRESNDDNNHHHNSTVKRSICKI